MKLDIKELAGCRVLYRVPNYLAEAEVRDGDKIIEMGTLSTYKLFMETHRSFKDSKYTASMRNEEDEGRDGFSGAESYEAFQELLNNGDEDVIKKIKIETTKQVAELSKKYEEVITDYKFDVQGQFFDVGLVLSGVPETWLEPEIKEEEKVQVEIIINGTFHAGISKNDVIKGASRILAMIKILEDHGVEVKLKIVSCIKGYENRKRNTKLFISTDVKDYDEPINYKKCSALLSPTYLRRGMFKVMELLAKEKLSGNYGQSYLVSNFINIHQKREIDELEKKLFKKDK